MNINIDENKKGCITYYALTDNVTKEIVNKAIKLEDGQSIIIRKKGKEYQIYTYDEWEA